MAGGELVAAYAWNSSYTRLMTEGILTWCDTLVLLNGGAASDDETYDYLNAALEPVVGKYMIEEFGFGSANRLAFDIADQAMVNEFGYTDPRSLIERSMMFEMWDPSVKDKSIAMFEEVKAALN
ncbi:MAG: hypothetical protein OXD40_05240 [bacterium]|nr:hypothetical protein [bacterium]